MRHLAVDTPDECRRPPPPIKALMPPRITLAYPFSLLLSIPGSLSRCAQTLARHGYHRAPLLEAASSIPELASRFPLLPSTSPAP
jgi:hypothetical protein